MARANSLLALGRRGDAINDVAYVYCNVQCFAMFSVNDYMVINWSISSFFVSCIFVRAKARCSTDK